MEMELLMNRRPLKSRGKGFGLVVLVLIVAALAVLAIGAILLSSRIMDVSSEGKTIERMKAVRDKAEEYFRGHETLPTADAGFQTNLDGSGAQNTAVPVDVDALNMKTLFRMDVWEQGLVYYVAPAGTKGNGLAGVLVNGNEEAGFILSFGPNQKYDSSLDTSFGVNPYVLTLAGDDIVVPINVKDEALEIVNEELQVLSRKQCAFRIASNDPGYWHLVTGSPPDDWSDFLATYGLQDRFRTDPWGRDYQMQYTLQPDPVRFFSQGVEVTGPQAADDDIYGPMLTNEACLPALFGTVNLVQNGDFEQGQFFPWETTFGTRLAGSSRIDNWTIDSGSVDHIINYWNGYGGAGSKSIDLNGLSAGAISQVLTTVPGQRYLLSFQMAGNPDGPDYIKTMNVSLSDVIGTIKSAPFAFYAIGSTTGALGDMRWSEYLMTFTARETSTTLAFQSTTYYHTTIFGFPVTLPSACGPTLDEVAVNATLRTIIDIDNPSFEMGATDDIGAFVWASPTNAELTDWTVELDGVDDIGSYWVSAHGNRSLDMHHDDRGRIFQDVPTTPGTTYRVTFILSGNGACGNDGKRLRVRARVETGPAVNVSQDYDFTVTQPWDPSAMGWSTQTFEFTAQETTTRLYFIGRRPDGSACGPALDFILVEVKP